MTRPLLAPGDEVILAGPDVPYRVVSLETSGADAVLHLRTVDGDDWGAKLSDPVHDVCGRPYSDHAVPMPGFRNRCPGPAAATPRGLPLRVTGWTPETGRVEGEVPPGPVADAIRASALRGLSLPEPEVAVRVCGLPDPVHLSPELEAVLADLARRVHEEYGLAVEVLAERDLDEVRDALDLIRRRLDL